MLDASPKRACDAARAERLDLGALLADHDVREAAPVERPGDQPSDLAVAAQDGVQPQRRAVVASGRQEGEVAGPPLEQRGSSAGWCGAAPRAGRRRWKSNGLSAIDSSAPATMSWNPSGGRSPSDSPTVPRMNENSPIWARPAPTVKATRIG